MDGNSSPPTTFIYGLKDPRTGEIRYVGKSDDPKNRLLRHISEARHRHQITYSFHWIRSLLSMGLLPLLEVLEEVPSHLWPERERHYIATLPNLTNHHPGGNVPPSSKGKIRSRETRERMSASQLKLGRRLSEEVRKHLSEINTGSLSPRWGKKNSPSHRKSISEGRKKPVACYDLLGKLVGCFESSQDASLSLGIASSDICRCVSNRWQQAGGFVWRLVEKGFVPPLHIEVMLHNKRKEGWSTKSKAVVQFTLAGEQVKIWPSLNQAARALCLDSGSICKCVQGLYKSCGGFRWSYAEALRVAS